jgi:hypothetical protein
VIVDLLDRKRPTSRLDGVPDGALLCCVSALDHDMILRQTLAESSHHSANSPVLRTANYAIVPVPALERLSLKPGWLLRQRGNR